MVKHTQAIRRQIAFVAFCGIGAWRVKNLQERALQFSRNDFVRSYSQLLEKLVKTKTNHPRRDKHKLNWKLRKPTWSNLEQRAFDVLIALRKIGWKPNNV